MNREKLRSVLEAIRDEGFQKAKSWLRVNDCYSIEGAFCEMYRREHPDTSKWIEEGGTIYSFSDGGPVSNCSALTSKVVTWLGGTPARSGISDFSIPGVGDLPNLNDSDRHFGQRTIAELASFLLEHVDEIEVI